MNHILWSDRSEGWFPKDTTYYFDQLVCAKYFDTIYGLINPFCTYIDWSQWFVKGNFQTKILAYVRILWIWLVRVPCCGAGKFWFNTQAVRRFKSDALCFGCGQYHGWKCWTGPVIFFTPGEENAFREPVIFEWKKSVIDSNKCLPLTRIRRIFDQRHLQRSPLSSAEWNYCRPWAPLLWIEQPSSVSHRRKLALSDTSAEHRWYRVLCE